MKNRTSGSSYAVINKSNSNEELQISILPYKGICHNEKYDIDSTIKDLEKQLDSLSCKADKNDYLVSIASGVLCGILDILWVGDFDLERGKNIASNKIEGFVKKTAKIFGCESNDLKSCVDFLEKKFPIPSDGNTPDFGGGLQHHLRDFAHHPTIVGLIFSLLTQFTYKSYGTTTYGKFLVVEVPAKSRAFIGKDVPTKILYGTIIWFFHLVSDMAGSKSTVGKSGGTGIPGPILSLAKELSVLPVFQNMSIDGHSLSTFLSKLFNGTLLAKHDVDGKIIKESLFKFDFRGELGIGIEIGRQATPVIANECIVRTFYFIRRLTMEFKENAIHSIDDMKKILWENVKPTNNPTIARMLTISTGVFTTIDIAEAVITEKYLLSVNYVGIGRFAIAIGQDVAWYLKARNVKKIKRMYEEIRQYKYICEDERVRRAEIEYYISEYFDDYYNCFDEALTNIKTSFESGDADGVIAGANQITKKLGGTVQYETVDEFKSFLDDDSQDFIL